MIDSLGYILVRFLSLLFCAMPASAGLFIARRFGTLIYLINRKRRSIAYANLKAAFCREKSPAEIKRIVKGVYQNLAQVFIELLRFPVTDDNYISKFISTNGLDRVGAARSGGKGVIILAAHFGNWELPSLVGGRKGFPVTVLAREQKHTRLNELLNSYRALSGSKVIKKGLATRELIKALRANEIIGIMGDQDAGKLGTLVNFFGRPASTHPGAFVFAEKTGAPIIPIFMIRQKGPYHRLEVLEPVDSAQKFSAMLEEYARKFPKQWLWVHKRWKSTPHRSIIILNDSKPGHLNQSLAVGAAIQKLREDRGYKPEDTACKIIDVKYKSGFSKVLLALCSRFCSRGCQGCMACVRFCLDEKSYKEVISSYADIVISCGSSLAPLNIFLTRECNAKNVVIMKPGLVSLGKFTLAIIPDHDRPKPAKNILVTAGAPNRITQEQIKKESEKFLSLLNLKAVPRLALILGGDNADFQMDIGLMREVIAQIKSVSKKFGMEILATSSRRTPADVEKLLKDEFAAYPNCKLLIIANEKNMEGAIPAFLGLCDAVLVSGESMSMVSEAASSGRAVLVFPLKKKHNKPTRHENLAQELSRTGHIKLLNADKIAEGLEAALSSKTAAKRLNDYEKIYNAVGVLG